jgi:ketosteroid isomerase-like protein
VAAVVALVSGCGTTPGTAAVERTADAWLAAARAGDAAALCRLVTPAAARSAATGDETCVQALGDLDLPSTGPVGAVQVWSDRAQVRTGDDTLFLTSPSRSAPRTTPPARRADLPPVRRR